MDGELYCTHDDGVVQGQFSGWLGQLGGRWIRPGAFGVGLHDGEGVCKIKEEHRDDELGGAGEEGDDENGSRARRVLQAQA